MNAVVIGAAIVALTALKAGPALWALTGRSWNRVLNIAWPLCLWLVALVLLFVLIPASPLLEGQQTQPVLVAASVAVSLVYALPLIRVGWHLWRDSGA
jgi:hypothetical protein